MPPATSRTPRTRSPPARSQWSQPFPTVNKPDESGRRRPLARGDQRPRPLRQRAVGRRAARSAWVQILDDIANQPGSRAGAGLTSVKLSGSSNYVYRVGFEPGWSGSLTKVQIDSKTGKETPIWNAADQLTTQVTKTVATPEPWFTNRRIVTRDETGKPQPFLWDKLPNLQRLVRAGQAARAARRWSRTCAAAPRTRAPKLGKFRAADRRRWATSSMRRRSTSARRTSPYKEINDPGYPALTSVGVAARDDLRRRQRRHAARLRRRVGRRILGVRPLGALPQAGSARVRRRHLPEPPRRARVPGGRAAEVQAPLHGRRSDPVADVDIGGSWKTMLVGGLGKGGKSFYAVDVTTRRQRQDRGRRCGCADVGVQRSGPGLQLRQAAHRQDQRVRQEVAGRRQLRATTTRPAKASSGSSTPRTARC